VTLLPHEELRAAGLDAARSDAVARQRARGKLTARQRIARLVDAGSFREIGALARPARGPSDTPLFADALVTGSAAVDGRPVVVIATDFTVAGGSNGDLGNEKQRRCWEMAATRGIPVVMLLDGGGHRIQEGLDAGLFGGGFDFQRLQARLSGWVPMVAAMLGPGFGQPTLAASLCDYVVAVRGLATLGMAPPALAASATGEQFDAETVCGADAQEAHGTIDLAVDSEEEALEALRWYLALMPSNAEAVLPSEPSRDPDADAAAGIDAAVPANLRRAYDMHAVIAGIVDADSEVELKAGFAANLITVVARVGGHQLGIVASQPAVKAGMLDADAAAKAAHFVSLCDAFGIPIMVIMDLPGLAVGADAERSGLARQCARLMGEFGATTVPTITVVARKGYGGGYIVMSGGRTFHPELVLAWPHAEMAAMGVEAAVDLVFRRDVGSAPDPQARREQLIEEISDRIGVIRAAEAFGVDAIVRPSETREWLIATLACLPRRHLMETLTPRRHAVTPV
jgi:propionyl-CoA carboxylase beta chain